MPTARSGSQMMRPTGQESGLDSLLMGDGCIVTFPLNSPVRQRELGWPWTQGRCSGARSPESGAAQEQPVLVASPVVRGSSS